MAAVWSWFRLDFRRRWRSLLALALLVTLATGVVMTAAAGARRGASALDRLLARTLPATVLVTPVTPGFDWEPVRALPQVEALTEILFSPFEVDGHPAPYGMMLPPADTEAMATIERPVVLTGRLADPTRADEVVITAAFEETHGKGVGDTVELRLFTPEQIDVGQIPVEAPTSLTALVWILTAEQMSNAAAAGTDYDENWRAAGPVVEATVVGVVRSPWFGDSGDTGGFVVPTPGLHAEHAPSFLGAEGSASINALIRLRSGEADIPGFRARLAEITGRNDIDVWNLAASGTKLGDVAGFEAASLGVFAAVAGVVAALLIGLAVTRHVVATVADIRVLSTMGMTPRQSRRAASLGPTLAALVGATVGAVVAILASRWFPVGLASVVEPTPGFDIDLAVLLVGLVVIPLLVAVTAEGAAMRALRRGASLTAERPSTIASTVAGAGLPVPVIVGTRFALERDGTRRGVPVRPVLLGAIAGVAGVMGALTFSSAVDDATTNPARSGMLYQVEAWVGFDNVPFWEPEPGFAAMAEVPGVTGVNDTRAQVAEAGGEQITVFSLDPFGSRPDYVLIEGRLPVAQGEVLLGRRSTEALDAGLGDTVSLAGTSSAESFDVVGIGFVDFIATIATGGADPLGAATTGGGYRALFGDEFRIRYGQVTLEAGIETEPTLPRLLAAAEGIPDPVWIAPAGVFEIPAELRWVRTLPITLAGFLALLALGAVGHALMIAMQGRRHDVAVLRALGMTQGQSRGVVTTQATVLALIGLLAGVPLGIAAGRTVWRYVADLTALHYVPPTAGRAVVVMVPIALGVVGLLAAWPSHRAATRPISEVLRAE